MKGYVVEGHCFGTEPVFVLLWQLVFDLAKQGMMRKFSGSWKLEPMKASESRDHGDTRATDQDDPVVGSWVHFQQIVEPAIKPPWPLNNYIRGIAEKIVREMLGDLQRECQRLSDVRNNTTSASENVSQQSWFCFPTPIFKTFALWLSPYWKCELLQVLKIVSGEVKTEMNADEYELKLPFHKWSGLYNLICVRISIELSHRLIYLVPTTDASIILK